MRRRRRHNRLELILLALALSGVGLAQAKKKKPPRRPPHPHHFQEDFFGMHAALLPDFQVEGAPLRQGVPEGQRMRQSMASTVIAIEGGWLALDRDSGQLTATDREGRLRASLAVGTHPTQMVWSPAEGLAWIADHDGNRVLAVHVGGADEGYALSAGRALTVHTPWGLALHPDGRRLFVTSSAEGSVRQIDTQVMKKTWERELGPETRAVAVSPDGARLMVGFLQLGAVAELELQSEVEAPVLDTIYHPIDPVGVPVGHAPANTGFGQQLVQSQAGNIEMSLPGGQVAGRTFARNNFVLAWLSPSLAVVPHQLSTPVADNVVREDRGGYGGGGEFSFPVSHRATFIEGERDNTRKVQASIGVHQPRALAYDPKHDRLYLVGHGDDTLLAIDEATQPTMHLGFKVALNTAADIPIGPSEAGVRACGADGIAVEGDRLAIHCALTRSLRFHDAQNGRQVGDTPALAASTRSAAAQRGAEVFRRGGDRRLSTLGAMACSSCHPEALTDGLSWRIQGRELQTPLISGRLVGTHPFKWDGQDADLPSSLRNTVGRLGGAGISESEANDLQAFLENLEPPRRPLSRRAHAVQRGRALFASEQLACDVCHGGPQFTDGQMHHLLSDLAQVDTPSLVGLARSAPYYHDGSAPTLRALLLDNGRVHGMSSSAKLSAEQLDDLIAYLETL